MIPRSVSTTFCLLKQNIGYKTGERAPGFSFSSDFAYEIYLDMPCMDNPLTSFTVSNIYQNDISFDENVLNEEIENDEEFFEGSGNDSCWNDLEDECCDVSILDLEMSVEFDSTLPYTSTPISHYEHNSSNVNTVKRRLFTSSEDDEVRVPKILIIIIRFHFV